MQRNYQHSAKTNKTPTPTNATVPNQMVPLDKLDRLSSTLSVAESKSLPIIHGPSSSHCGLEDSYEQRKAMKHSNANPLQNATS
jgi:hypothetical protein